MKLVKIILAFALVTGMASFVAAQNAAGVPQSNSSQNPPQNPMSNSTQTAMSNSGESSSTDAQLMQQLQSRFSQDPAFENVQVSVTDHAALLTGTVASKDDRTRAEQLAKSMKGIRSVKDQLAINANAGKSSNNPTTASGATANAASGTAVTATSGAATSNSASGEAHAEQAGNPNTAPNTTAPSPAPPQDATSAPATSGGVTGAIAGNPTTTTTKSGATPSAIGSNAGAATPGASASSNIDSIENASTLQGQIQNALQNEPTLHNDSVNVNVTESTIELSGIVQSGKEKQTADRIANSFAGNRRVRDRITVGKGGSSNLNPSSSDLNSKPARQSGTSNPQSNQSNQNNQNPSSNNPAANGDASSNPR